MELVKKYEELLIKMNWKEEDCEKIFNELVKDGYYEKESWIDPKDNNINWAIMIRGEKVDE